MYTTLQTIIDSIPRGSIFDSHFIIEQLIQNHSDVYINYVSKFSSTPMPTFTAHGNIGKEIAKFNGTAINQLENESFSYNIHNNPGSCTAWQKI